MKSLPDQSTSGSGIQPSAPDAAPLSIPTALPCSRETLLCLSAICSNLLYETLSEDSILIALRMAERDALQAGISPAEFQRVKEVILRHWTVKRAQNPLSKLF